MLVSLVLGTGVGVVSLIGTRYGSVERMLEAIVSIAAAFLARLFVEYVYPACWGAISLSTIVWMLPGIAQFAEIVCVWLCVCVCVCVVCRLHA
jgi:uncharacterized membrane protein YjjP (DUF1212 family)